MIRNIMGWAALGVFGVAWGCDSGNTGGGFTSDAGVGGAGGTGSNVGGSGNTGNTTCSAAAPCGGTVDGTWQLDGVCVEGNLVAAMNATSGLPAACSTLFQTATLSGTGTVTFANGTETDNITQDMTTTAVYTSACASAIAGTAVTLNASLCATMQSSAAGQTGVTSASCSFVGSNCNCSIVYQSVTATSQAYSISGSTIMYTNGSDPIDYCVSGTTLTARQVQTNLNGLTFVSTLHKSG